MTDIAAPTHADSILCARTLRPSTRPFIDSGRRLLHALEGCTQLKATWMDLS